MDRARTCCFTGHRPEKLPWRNNEADPRCIALKERLDKALEAAYHKGMRHFLCGMAQGADFYFCEAALALRDKLFDAGIRVETDLRNEKINLKIREAQVQKIPYMLVLGEKEAESGMVAVRSRKGTQEVMSTDALLAKLLEEIRTKAL